MLRVVKSVRPRFYGLEWRNWQTHETQNLALRKQHGGSTPPSSTNSVIHLTRLRRVAAILPQIVQCQ